MTRLMESIFHHLLKKTYSKIWSGEKCYKIIHRAYTGTLSGQSGLSIQTTHDTRLFLKYAIVFLNKIALEFDLFSKV